MYKPDYNYEHEHSMKNEPDTHQIEAERKPLYEPFVAETEPPRSAWHPQKPEDGLHNRHMREKKPPTPDDRQILELLKAALKDEEEDAAYYAKLMNELPLSEHHDKEIIRHIRNDECKHHKIIESIYCRVAGKKPPEIRCEDKSPTGNLVKDFEKSIFGELEGSAFYRKLYFLFCDMETRDMLYEIITDEQCHATKFCYLYSKYRHTM